jgi:hypothetical protein
MAPLPIADWQAALAEMDAALTAVLGGNEPGWDDGPPGGRPSAEDDPLGRLEGRLREWDDRLKVAAELAASVEREVAEREGAVARWQELFTRWREVIQRGVEPGPGGG